MLLSCPVFAFDFVTLETVLCFMSVLSTGVTNKLELYHGHNHVVVFAVTLV